jgi:acyl dehydratase
MADPQRLSHDAQQMESALVDSSLETSANLDGYSDYLSGKPYRALHTLALALTPTSVPSHLQICSAALYHHSRISLSRAGLLMHAKAASGKFEPDVSKPAALKWLQKWVTDKKEVRRVLWHAGVLNALLSEFPRGYVWLVQDAMGANETDTLPSRFGRSIAHSSFGSSSSMGRTVSTAPSSSRPSSLQIVSTAASGVQTCHELMATGFDVDPPSMWLTHGGQIFLPFLGSSTALKIRDTLEHFIRQMSAMPWGLAAFQKQVLTLLLEAEDGGGGQSKA